MCKIPNNFPFLRTAPTTLLAVKNSVGSRTAAVGNVAAAIVARVAHSGRLRTNAAYVTEKGY